MVWKRFDPTARESRAIRMASKHKHIGLVHLLLQDGRANPGARHNEAIREASARGHARVVRLLPLQEKRVNPSYNFYDDSPLCLACMNGHRDVVRLLLRDRRVCVSEERNSGIQHASERGRTGVLELLLQDRRIDPSVNRNNAIRLESENGHVAVVRLLLRDRRVDPSDTNK